MTPEEFQKFQEWVDRLEVALKPGTRIPHWSPDGSHEDSAFTISRKKIVELTGNSNLCNRDHPLA